jgi:hypothetical protein
VNTPDGGANQPSGVLLSIRVAGPRHRAPILVLAHHALFLTPHPNVIPLS